MSLVNLKTDLKSLRYGGDMYGGGSSNQPYIQKPIPESTQPGILSTGGPDSLLRGGITAPIRAFDDVVRLSKMFFDVKSPNGFLFIAKQNLLSRINVKTQASRGAGYGGGGFNQGIYLPTSTIAQAGVGFTGYHLNLFGLNPFSPVSPDKGGSLSPLGLNSYDNIVKNQDSNAVRSYQEANRLVGLLAAISGDKEIRKFGGQRGVNLNAEDGSVIMEYGGGPDSILGIGKTKIKFADRQRTGKNNITAKNINTVKSFLGNSGLTVVTSPEDFYPPQSNGNFSPASPFFEELIFRNTSQNIGEDFRKTKIEKNKITDFSTIISAAPGYTNTSGKALDQRVNQGSPGAANTANGAKNVFNYGIPANEMEALDKITAMPMYENTGSALTTEKAVNDLCKFRIATINNNKSDGSAVYMHFRAFINDFNDNYGATWNQVQYVGRGDSLANYGGFTRNISIGFTVAAQSKAELIPMYKKLNYLASTLAPDYTDSGFMRGNLVRITMGGYLYEQPGYLTSLTYTIPQESPWEIAIDEKGNKDKSVKELPHIITVSLAFTPIHNFLPQKGGNPNNPDQRYIALANAFNSRGNYADEYKFGIPTATAGGE